MRLVILDDDGAVADQIRGFGWEVAGSPHDGAVDAILVLAPDSVPPNSEIPVIQLLQNPQEVSALADDFLIAPLRKEYLALRIAGAQRRRQQSRNEWLQLLHDLRSPLNAIQGYAEMLAEEVQGEPARYAARILLAVRQMEEMIGSQSRKSV